jgi:hypothetical protein
VSMEFNHIALTTGIAIHASESIQVGVAPGFLFPTARMVFDEDTRYNALDSSASFAEDPGAAARYQLATKGIIAPSYFLSFGAHYRHGRLDVGLAYTTAPLGHGGSIKFPLNDVNIALPSNLSGSPGVCEGAATSNCLAGQMSYRLPSIYTAGATFHATKSWAVTGIVRWIRTSSHDKITVLVTGPEGSGPLGTIVPNHVVLYRGFNDSVDVRGRLVYETKQIRIGTTLRFESSAIPASHVNAAAIDGPKIEPSIAAEMRIWRQIHLSVGYAFMWMFPVDTGTSVFDPTATSACAAANGDIASPACRARMDGQARPTAAGSYRMYRHSLSLLTTFGF